MTQLEAVVHGLAARDGVEAVLLLSGEGLPIEQASEPAPRGALDTEAVAALAATLAQHAGRLGQAAARGELATAVLEFRGGLLLLARAGTGDWLAILAAPDADVGPLLFDLRQHRSALASLL
jgi:predicted regulator of Ras-like GTPase activity (Roadblock/LC7/MglB family)